MTLSTNVIPKLAMLEEGMGDRRLDKAWRGGSPSPGTASLSVGMPMGTASAPGDQAALQHMEGRAENTCPALAHPRNPG